MEDTTKKQIERALILLKNDLPAKIDNIMIKVQENNLIMYGKSHYNIVDNLTQEIVINELKEYKEIFNEIIKNNNEFHDFINNKIIRYSLIIDINGKMFEEICREENGEIKWMMDI